MNETNKPEFRERKNSDSNGNSRENEEPAEAEKFSGELSASGRNNRTPKRKGNIERIESGQISPFNPSGIINPYGTLKTGNEHLAKIAKQANNPELFKPFINLGLNSEKIRRLAEQAQRTGDRELELWINFLLNEILGRQRQAGTKDLTKERVDMIAEIMFFKILEPKDQVEFLQDMYGRSKEKAIEEVEIFQRWVARYLIWKKAVLQESIDNAKNVNEPYSGVEREDKNEA